jgi:hypothetical protein
MPCAIGAERGDGGWSTVSIATGGWGVVRSDVPGGGEEVWCANIGAVEVMPWPFPVGGGRGLRLLLNTVRGGDVGLMLSLNTCRGGERFSLKTCRGLEGVVSLNTGKGGGLNACRGGEGVLTLDT